MSLAQENPYHTHKSKPLPLEHGEERHRFELASPFGPYPGEDGLDRQFAKEILHDLRSGWEDLRATEPELYVGCTVHGSSVKGRMHDKSDLDVTVFFDPDSSGLKGFDLSKYLRTNQGIVTKAVNGPRPGHAANLKDRIVSFMHVGMNDRLIDESIASLEAAHAKSQGASSSSYISLFDLRIGGGKVAHFRQKMLSSIAQSEHADEIWKQLAAEVVRHDEHRRGAQIYFPDNLRRADEHYGLTLPENYLIAQEVIQRQKHTHHLRRAMELAGVVVRRSDGSSASDDQQKSLEDV